MRLESERLIIRPWLPRDASSFAEINADPEVRRYYYPATLSRAESDAVIHNCTTHLDEHGFAFLAVERKSDQALIGGAGLSWTSDTPNGPAIEIGWILGRKFWRQGYAEEVSRTWFAYGWKIGLDEIVGYTSEINHPSRYLMNALGMSHDPKDDFVDSTVPEGNPLRPHVLFRISNPTRS
jgi:RimJ/RimL family protein N-acetyltransferase